MTKNATVSATQSVYYGPSVYGLYPTIGKVYSGESVEILWRERHNDDSNAAYFYYIEYKIDGVEEYKRGYVPVGSVTPNSSTTIIDLSTTILSNSYSYCTVDVGGNTYAGPNSSTYTRIGAVYAGERIWRLNTFGTWAFIEYTISDTQRKRGYFPRDNFTAAQ